MRRLWSHPSFSFILPCTALFFVSLVTVLSLDEATLSNALAFVGGFAGTLGLGLVVPRSRGQLLEPDQVSAELQRRLLQPVSKPEYPDPPPRSKDPRTRPAVRRKRQAQRRRVRR